MDSFSSSPYPRSCYFRWLVLQYHSNPNPASNHPLLSTGNNPLQYMRASSPACFNFTVPRRILLPPNVLGRIPEPTLTLRPTASYSDNHLPPYIIFPPTGHRLFPLHRSQPHFIPADTSENPNLTHTSRPTPPRITGQPSLRYIRFPFRDTYIYSSLLFPRSPCPHWTFLKYNSNPNPATDSHHRTVQCIISDFLPPGHGLILFFVIPTRIRISIDDSEI